MAVLIVWLAALSVVVLVAVVHLALITRDSHAHYAAGKSLSATPATLTDPVVYDQPWESVDTAHGSVKLLWDPVTHRYMLEIFGIDDRPTNYALLTIPQLRDLAVWIRGQRSR